MVDSGFATALAPGTVISGKYRVERVLGKGGMGIVVAARHLDLHQTLAIKVLLPTASASEEAITRFVREGRSAAQLTSPHVAKVHDTGHLDTGEPYLVMELLHGSDLRAHLSEVGSVPLAKAIAWVLQAAHAIAEAHQLNIIHRDIKPANLFLAESSTGEQIKVLDFGVAKQLGVSDDLTSSMATIGTPRYMAPEQMRSAKLADWRGDIWSLGVVLYELTTGQHPFQGDSITSICFDVMERTPTAPSELNPALPPVFDEVIARCLEKNPDDRFQSVQELASALYRIAPDSARFSGFFNPASSEPMGAVPGVTPMPALTPDPTGPTKVHREAARPSQPGVVAFSDATGATKPHPQPARSSQPGVVAFSDATGATKPHPQPARSSQPGVVAFSDATGATKPHPQPIQQPFAAPLSPATTPPLVESPPWGLAVQGPRSGNSSVQPRADVNQPRRNGLIALAVGVAIAAALLLSAGLASRRSAKAEMPDTPSPPSTTSVVPSPVASLSSAPPEPVVVVLDLPSPSSSALVAPSSSALVAPSIEPPVVATPQKLPFGAHAPTPGCYFFDERGHKHVNKWCR